MALKIRKVVQTAPMRLEECPSCHEKVDLAEDAVLLVCTRCKTRTKLKPRKK